jgi:DNA-binding transcriptional LysR family regulator
MLLHFCGEVFDIITQLETVMLNASHVPTGHLKIGINHIWWNLLPRYLVEFRKAHSLVSLEVLVQPGRTLADLLLQNALDLAFVSEEPDISQIEALPIAQDEMVIAASPDHPLATGKPVKPAEAGVISLFLRGWDSPARPIHTEYLRNLGIEYHILPDIWGGYEDLKLAVQSGLGLAMTSKYAVLNELASGALKQVKLDAPPCMRTLFVARLRARPITLVQQAFLAFVVSKLREDGLGPGERTLLRGQKIEQRTHRVEKSGTSARHPRAAAPLQPDAMKAEKILQLGVPTRHTTNSFQKFPFTHSTGSGRTGTSTRSW